MSITFHWWAIPALITFCYFVWAVLPRYQSHLWGDFEALFGHIIGLLLCALSWAIAGIFFK